MEIRPLMDIRFDGTRENDLLEDMKSRATDSGLWQWQDHNPFGKPPGDGRFYFHHDQEPFCTVCIHREEAGHFIVRITPDESGKMPVKEFVQILNDFDAQVAGPAAETLSGITSIDTSKRTLHDYFSREAVRLLELFCTTPEDQEKWFDFVLYIHRNSENIHCDIFGYCLRDTGWWPEGDIDQLVQEYDFAQLLLKRSEHKS